MVFISIKEIGKCEICQKKEAVLLYQRRRAFVKKTFLCCRECCEIIQKEVLVALNRDWF